MSSSSSDLPSRTKDAAAAAAAAADSESEKLVAPADFSGPTDRRQCTDIGCLGILLVVWIGLTAIGAYSVHNGDIRRVLYPIDYRGNVCGTNLGPDDMSNYSYLYYVNSLTGGVCVAACPDFTGIQAARNDANQTIYNVTADVRTLVTYSGNYQPYNGVYTKIGLDFVETAPYYYPDQDSTDTFTTNTTNSSSNDTTTSFQCSSDLCFPNATDPSSSWTSDGLRRGFGYANYAGDSRAVLQRCFLTAAAKETILNETQADTLLEFVAESSVAEFIMRLYTDLYTARKYVLGFGLGGSLAMSILYVFGMRLPAVLEGLIWSSIAATIVMFIVGGWYTTRLASQWDTAPPPSLAAAGATKTEQVLRAARALSIVLYVVAAILAALAICLRRQIQLAISCTKEAGRAVNNMLVILLVPVFQAIALCVFLAVAMIYAVHLASLGTIQIHEFQGIPYRTFEFDNFVWNCGWYLIFCLFWTANFIVACGDMIVSLSVAKWYFTKDKVAIGSWTVLMSIWQVLFYHAGTCAFGSFIIAVVQVIRAIIARLQTATKVDRTRISGFLLCCCQCCFCCLEKCLKFVTKNAYIQTAIFSTSFCGSCQQSFWLIFRNARRITAVSYVSAAVLIVGKLFISSMTTIGAYLLLTQDEIYDQLYSIGGPLAVIFLISYWMSDFFMDVFDMAISTILHCFIADEEMFTGDECFADAGLKAWIDTNGGGSSDTPEQPKN